MFTLSPPDDMSIKLWDWEKKWQCSQVFEGHSHYVMMIVLNPKDHNQFASASLDRTIKVSPPIIPFPLLPLPSPPSSPFFSFSFKRQKLARIPLPSPPPSQVWQLGSPTPNFTLEGHEKGINCVDYFQGGDKPYLISGADDRYFPSLHILMTSYIVLPMTINFLIFKDLLLMY